MMRDAPRIDEQQTAAVMPGLQLPAGGCTTAKRPRMPLKITASAVRMIAKLFSRSSLPPK